MKTNTLQTSMPGNGYSRWVRLLILATIFLGHIASAGNPADPVDLGDASNFVILAKSGISTVPNSDITGDLGVSPIASNAITGFNLTLDASGVFSTSDQVDGRIYAADYAEPTPSSLTTAISDMETAYSDAAGRSPDVSELAGGNIGGLVLPPGVFSWSTNVSIDDDIVLSGDSGDVWIFQIAGDLTLASGVNILLSGDVQAKNIFWQVAGGAGAEIGTDAHFEGVLLTAAGINVLTAASVNGKLLAQTDVNLQMAIIVDSGQTNQYTLTYTAGLGGSINGDSPQLVMEGEDGTPVTAEADPGFMFVQWSDGSTLNPRSDLNVMEDITVEAEFQESDQINQYTLTYTAGLGGSIDGDSPQLVMEGEDGTPVTAEADPGFMFVRWSDESTLNPRADLNVMEDITVEAQFQESGVAAEAIAVPTLNRLGLLLLVLMLILAGGWFIRRQAMLGHS